MGYAHGKQWNEELIKEAVFEVVTKLELDRMPTRKEMDEYFGNAGLSGKVSKSGGFYHYANIFGLSIKSTESAFGIKYEHIVKDMLVSLGNDAELTTTKFPYDILVNKRVKVDVKVGRIVKTRDCDYYTFNLEKKNQTCDIYAVVALDRADEIKKMYVIPASVMSGKSQLSIGITNSKYDKYIDRWDLIEMLDRAFIEIEAS